MTPEMALGKAIKVRRIEADLSQEQLAELCEVDRTYISNIERGNRQPSYKTLRLIATALSTRASEILHDAETREDAAKG